MQKLLPCLILTHDNVESSYRLFVHVTRVLFDRFQTFTVVFVLDILLEGNVDSATRFAAKAISHKEYFSFSTADGYGTLPSDRNFC